MNWFHYLLGSALGAVPKHRPKSYWLTAIRLTNAFILSFHISADEEKEWSLHLTSRSSSVWTALLPPLFSPSFTHSFQGHSGCPLLFSSSLALKILNSLSLSTRLFSLSVCPSLLPRCLSLIVCLLSFPPSLSRSLSLLPTFLFWFLQWTAPFLYFSVYEYTTAPASLPSNEPLFSFSCLSTLFECFIVFIAHPAESMLYADVYLLLL